MDNDHIDGEAVSSAVKVICEAFEENEIEDKVGFTALIGLAVVTAVDMNISEDDMIKVIKVFYADELSSRWINNPNTLLH